MKFFLSKNVNVFPCAYRGSYKVGDQTYYFNAEAIIQSEFNFTNTPSSHWKPSYLIKYDISNDNKKLYCVLGGYYFYIDLSDKTDAELAGLTLCINTVDKTISSGDNNQTKVLAYLKDTGAIDGSALCLDKTIDPDHPSDSDKYYFHGIGYDASNFNGITLKVFQDTLTSGKVVINYKSLLPEINHGSNDGDTLINGDTKIALGGSGNNTVYSAEILKHKINFNKPVNIAAGQQLSVGSSTTQTIIIDNSLSTTNINATKIKANDNVDNITIESKNPANSCITVKDSGTEITGMLTAKNGADIKNGAITINAPGNLGVNIQRDNSNKLTINDSGTTITDTTSITGITNINTGANACNTTIGTNGVTTQIKGTVNINGSIDVSYSDGVLTITKKSVT